MKFKDITRRTLIRGAGGAAIGLPFLELTSEKVWAQQGAIKRLVIYFNGEGNIIDRWKPAVSSGSALPAALPPMLTALNGYRDKLLLMHPVDNVVATMMGGNGHNKAGRSILSCNVFTGGESTPAAGPSIDQYMKQKLALKSLELKVGSDNVGEYQMLFSGPGQSVSGESSPQRAFDRLFKDLVVGGTTPPPVATLSAADRLRNKNKDLLSLVKENFTTIRGQLGREDQLRLDAHAQRLGELEKEVGTIVTPPKPVGGGAVCAKPVLGGLSGHPAINKAQAQITANAIACDLARIVTIQDTDYDGQSFSWLGAKFPGNWHGAVHDRLPEAERCFPWYATAFKDILDAMNAIPEGDGTLLDNSLVMWITEYGDGSSHNTLGIPVIWAGGLNGAVKMNRFLSFPNNVSSTNKLFVTIMQLFGMQENSFGVGNRNTGTLPGVV